MFVGFSRVENDRGELGLVDRIGIVLSLQTQCTVFVIDFPPFALSCTFAPSFPAPHGRPRRRRGATTPKLRAVSLLAPFREVSRWERCDRVLLRFLFGSCVRRECVVQL